jgi:hypothetical protein
MSGTYGGNVSSPSVAISRLAIQHFGYPAGVVKAILKEFLEKLLSQALEEKKDLQSLRRFNYMLGL